jgi:hypothetical protein
LCLGALSCCQALTPVHRTCVCSADPSTPVHRARLCILALVLACRIVRCQANDVAPGVARLYGVRHGQPAANIVQVLEVVVAEERWVAADIGYAPC